MAGYETTGSPLFLPLSLPPLSPFPCSHISVSHISVCVQPTPCPTRCTSWRSTPTLNRNCSTKSTASARTNKTQILTYAVLLSLVVVVWPSGWFLLVAQDLKQLVWLDCVINEALRLLPPGAVFSCVVAIHHTVAQCNLRAKLVKTTRWASTASPKVCAPLVFCLLIVCRCRHSCGCAHIHDPSRPQALAGPLGVQA